MVLVCDLAVLGKWFDLILNVFSNQNDSSIVPFYNSHLCFIPSVSTASRQQPFYPLGTASLLLLNADVLFP